MDLKEAKAEVVEPQKARAIKISKRAIIMGVVIVLALYVIACVLTAVLPKGAYERGLDDNGNAVILNGTYAADPELEGLEWWEYILAPVMILSPSVAGSATVWAILLLLLIIGAVFTALDESGILVYMVQRFNQKFGNRKYLLLFLLCFAFMFLGSTAGMFEELIPLVPVVVMLCFALSWDSVVALTIVVVSSCLGFTAGIVNPFTVGVAQQLGGIDMYSGIEVRLLVFVICYIVLMLFLYPYAKRIEKHPEKSLVYKQDLDRKKELGALMDDFTPDPKKGRALVWFGAWMLVVVAYAVVMIFVDTFTDFRGLSDAVMFVILAIYVIAGVGACVICGLKGKRLLKQLGKGTVTLLPAIAMILVAGGIRYIIEGGQVMDTILYYITGSLHNASPFSSTMLSYLLIFVFEALIPSGSAKAFLLMPMVYNLFDLAGISRQVAVLAFTFADGFGNLILPTNAGLLLILGLTTVDYGKWFKWCAVLLLILFLLTVGVLALAQFVVFA